MAKEIYRSTDDHVRAYRCGYSGNGALPQPDVLVTDTMQNHALELKGPIASERVYVEADDVDQLVECQTANTAVYLVVKFQRREPMVVRYFDQLSGGQKSLDGADEYDALSAAEKLAVLVPDPFDPRVTDGGALALDKPETSSWPSASAGSDDVDAILSGIGIATDKSTEIDLPDDA